jgi:DnaJ-class molecular chaperone
MKKTKPCLSCSGTGWVLGTRAYAVTCTKCGGTGERP